MKTDAKLKFLVTGATGFVGSYLVPALLGRYGPGAVIAIANQHLRPREELALRKFQEAKVPVIRCDLLDLPHTAPAPPEFDVLVHLAAYVETERASEKIAVNTRGTRNLLDWLGPRLAGKRVVYTGTLASVDRPGRPRGPIVETTPCTPRTEYGRSKLEAEQIIQARGVEAQYHWTILRLCTILGDGYRLGGMFDVFPQLLRRNALGTRLNWPGKTSLLCVSDLVEILAALPELPETKNESYVLTNGEAPTFDQLLQQIAEILGLTRHRIVLPRWCWEVVGAVAVFGADKSFLPHALRTFCWRVSLMVYDGFYGDNSKWNQLRKLDYRSIREGLREAYGVDRG